MGDTGKKSFVYDPQVLRLMLTAKMHRGVGACCDQGDCRIAVIPVLRIENLGGGF